MTVAELLELLKNCPLTMEVGYWDGNYGWLEITGACEIDAWHTAPGGLTKCRVLKLM